jgi:hypothetical protein
VVNYRKQRKAAWNEVILVFGGRTDSECFGWMLVNASADELDKDWCDLVVEKEATARKGMMHSWKVSSDLSMKTDKYFFEHFGDLHLVYR